jgi:hypothetical protein
MLLLLLCIDFQPRKAGHLPELILPDKPSSNTLSVERGVLSRECYGVQNMKDTLGADFVYVEVNTDRVHRFQLKLGQSRLQEEDFRTVSTNFTTMKKLAVDAYNRVGLNLEADSKLYLITTRSYVPADANALGDKIHLISKTTLNRYNVWPAQVKDLGKPYN